MKLGFSAVCAASLTFLPAVLAAAPVAVAPVAGPASYQFALGKLLAVEGSVNDALAAFDQAEAMAPDSPDTAYVLLEHAQLLGRMSQYARNAALREDSLKKAAEKIDRARRLAPDNLDVLRAVGEIYIDLAAGEPGSLAIARDALEAVRKRAPDDAQSLLTLGRIYLDQNQPAKAAEVFRQLVNNVPEQRMGYALLVESLMRANKPQEAEKALAEILASDPGALEARLTLADLETRRGDAPAALKTLREAPEEAREDPRLRRQLAWSLYQNGDLDEALKLVEPLAAATAAPAAGQSAGQTGSQTGGAAAGQDAEARQALLLLRGLILTAQGRNDDAIAALGKAHETEPKDLGIALALARVMERAGRRDDAARLLGDVAAALEKDGKTKEAQDARLDAAQVWFDAKQWDRAAEALRPLLAAPDDAVRLQALAETADSLARAKRYDEALALLAQQKDSPEVIAKRAEVLWRSGQQGEAEKLLAGLAAGGEPGAMAAAQSWQRLEKYQESIPILEKLTAAHPDQPIAGFLLGSAYERAGRRDQAIAELQRVLKVQPDFHAAMNYLGYTFADAGLNLEEALRLVSRAVALDPDNGAYVDSLGWTYYRLGRPEQARGFLERAARLEPEDATLQEHLGDVYVALGQTERARQAYQRALEIGGDNTDQVRRKLGDLDKGKRLQR